MQQDSLVITGTHGLWQWAVLRNAVADLDRLVVNLFPSHHLCIAAFDCGPIKPTPEEQALGWTLIDAMMISPPIHSHLKIPCDNHDEWYVLERLPIAFPKLERFVKYCGYHLIDSEPMANSFYSTCDHPEHDGLIPIQEQFWKQLEEINPIAYIASGDNDIVVSIDQTLITQFLKFARSTTT